MGCHVASKQEIRGTDNVFAEHDVLIVDDHPLVRESLANLINNQPGLKVCAEASSVKEAIDQLSTRTPRVAIVDLSLGERSGLELVDLIRRSYPQVAVIVLTMHEEKHYAERVIRAGARGYITKREGTKEIIGAIYKVIQGGLALSPQTTVLFSEKYLQAKPAASRLESLSNRELEVFRLLGQGFDTREIATRLGLSIKTIQTFCARMKEKLDLANGNELVHEAISLHQRGTI
jgi:DNA-binding NarL/FixJ family response regulator